MLDKLSKFNIVSNFNEIIDPIYRSNNVIRTQFSFSSVILNYYECNFRFIDSDIMINIIP
jgi:hypothetical protein